MSYEVRLRCVFPLKYLFSGLYLVVFIELILSFLRGLVLYLVFRYSCIYILYGGNGAFPRFKAYLTVQGVTYATLFSQRSSRLPKCFSIAAFSGFTASPGVCASRSNISWKGVHSKINGVGFVGLTRALQSTRGWKCVHSKINGEQAWFCGLIKRLDLKEGPRLA